MNHKQIFWHYLCAVDLIVWYFKLTSKNLYHHYSWKFLHTYVSLVEWKSNQRTYLIILYFAVTTDHSLGIKKHQRFRPNIRTHNIVNLLMLEM